MTERLLILGSGVSFKLLSMQMFDMQQTMYHEHTPRRTYHPRNGCKEPCGKPDFPSHCEKHSVGRSPFKAGCSKCLARNRVWGHYIYCNRRTVLLERAKKWRITHQEEYKATTRKNNTKWRLVALRTVIAGGVDRVTGSEVLLCAKCGCDDTDFLEINHKNGGGSKEAKLRPRYTSMPDRVLYGGRSPSDLEILCRPCNSLDHLQRRFPNKNMYPTVVWRSS